MSKEAAWRAILLWVSAVTALCAAPQDVKSPVPPEAERERVAKEIRELFKDDYAKRDRDSLRDLALKLLAQADQVKSDMTSRFGLLCAARDAAADAGDVETALSAVDRISEGYDLAQGLKTTAAAMKLETLSSARRRMRTKEEQGTLAEAYLATAQSAIAEGDHDSALAAAREASRAARAAGDRELSNRAGQLVKEIPQLKKERDAAAKAELTLTVNPDDKDANYALGMYLCFVKDAWERGLACLAKGSDVRLGKVAEKELAGAENPDAQAEVGDGWFELFEKERNPLLKNRYQMRARAWYEKALVEAEGLVKIRIERRLASFPVSRIPVDLLKLIDPAKDKQVGNWTFSGRTLVVPQGPATKLQIPYHAPEEYDLLMIVARKVGNDGLGIVLTSGESQFMVALDGFSGTVSGIFDVDKKGAQNNETLHSGSLMMKDRKTTVVFSVRRTGVKVTVNGKAIITWKGDRKRLSMNLLFLIPDRRALGILAANTQFHIERLVLTAVSGAGKALR